MKRISILIIVLIKAVIISCQVPLVFLNSQSQVDSFNINYPEFYGDIQISGEDIVSLDSMYKLNEVCSLSISMNPCLINIDGFGNLETAAEIIINNNDSLKTINGFNFLKHLTNKITITMNNKLEIISGFNQIDTVDNLFISANLILEEISGFTSLTRIGRRLSLPQNKMLSNLIGFSNLRVIRHLDGYPQYGYAKFEIGETDSLTSLIAFSGLVEVEGITIAFCPLLENLNGLQNINCTLEYFRLETNNTLNDITAMENAQFTDDAVMIFNNPNLMFCSIIGICDIECPSYNLIYNNAPGCDSWYEIDSICSMISVTESAVPGFTLFPNPVKDELTVNFGSNQNDSALSLYSVTGILIRTYQVYGDNFRMDVSDLPGGVYMLFIDNSFAVKFLKL